MLNGPTEFGNKFPSPVQFTTDPKRISEIYDILFCVRGSTTGRMNWSDQKWLPVMEHEPGAINSWAPELFFDEASNEYLIVWASTIPGRFPDTDPTKAGAGPPGWNHRLYSASTKDFRTFAPTKLFYDRGFNVIDAAIFRDHARYAMVLKDETDRPFTPQKNVRLAFSDHA